MNSYAAIARPQLPPTPNILDEAHAQINGELMALHEAISTLEQRLERISRTPDSRTLCDSTSIPSSGVLFADTLFERARDVARATQRVNQLIDLLAV